MRYQIIPVTPLMQNCTLFIDEASGKAVVIDPGGEVDRILTALEAEGAELEAILVTHGHVDHCGGVAAMAARTGVPIYGPHPEDRFWIEALQQQAQMFGLSTGGPFEPDAWLEQGDTVRFGTIELQVLHCPGHTPGHVVFHYPAGKLAQVGDVLFKGSIGRTDFPRGDHRTLIRSIREVLFPLGDEVRFIPGHGPISTFGEERLHNPFCGDAVAAG